MDKIIPETKKHKQISLFNNPISHETVIDFTEFFRSFEESINLEEDGYPQLIELLQKLDGTTENPNFMFPISVLKTNFYNLFFHVISPTFPPEIRFGALCIIRNLTYGCFYHMDFFNRVISTLNSILFEENNRDYFPICFQILLNISSKKDRSYLNLAFNLMPFLKLLSLYLLPDLTPLIYENFSKFIVSLNGISFSEEEKQTLFQILINESIPSHPITLILCWLSLQYPELFKELPSPIIYDRLKTSFQIDDPTVFHTSVFVLMKFVEKDPASAVALVQPSIFRHLHDSEISDDLFSTLVYFGATLIENYGPNGIEICSDAHLLEIACGSSPDDLSIKRKDALITLISVLMRFINRNQISQIFSLEIFKFIIEYLKESESTISRLQIIESLEFVLKGENDDAEMYIKEVMENEGGWDVIAELMGDLDHLEIQQSATLLYQYKLDDEIPQIQE